MASSSSTCCTVEDLVDQSKPSSSGPTFHAITKLVTLEAELADGCTEEGLSWSFTKKPSGSNAQLSNTSDSTTSSFTPDVPGEYTVKVDCSEDDSSASFTVVGFEATFELHWGVPYEKSHQSAEAHALNEPGEEGGLLGGQYADYSADPSWSQGVLSGTAQTFQELAWTKAKKYNTDHPNKSWRVQMSYWPHYDIYLDVGGATVSPTITMDVLGTTTLFQTQNITGDGVTVAKLDGEEYRTGKQVDINGNVSPISQGSNPLTKTFTNLTGK